MKKSRLLKKLNSQRWVVLKHFNMPNFKYLFPNITLFIPTSGTYDKQMEKRYGEHYGEMFIGSCL